jgi:hypothetical protein
LGRYPSEEEYAQYMLEGEMSEEAEAAFEQFLEEQKGGAFQ